MTSPVLHIAQDLLLDLTAYAQTGWRAGVWASSGRGKSHTVGVIVEELLDAGIPVVILDPEGELWTLREAYRTLVVGGPHADLPATSSRVCLREVLATALAQRLVCIFDLSEAVTNAGQQSLGGPVLEELFALQTRERRTVGLIIEEVQVFAPQSTPSTTSEIMARIAKQGRKRGILLVVASQRTQAVSKEFMSQLNFPIIGGFEERLDFEAVKHHAAGKVFEDLNRLEVGDFWLPKLRSFHHIRVRKVTHGGDTPEFGGEVTLKQTVSDQNLDGAIAHLAEILRKAEREEKAERGEVAALKRRFEELETLLATKDEEIRQYEIALKVAAAQNAARAGSHEQPPGEKTGAAAVEADKVEAKTVPAPKPSRRREPRPQEETSRPQGRVALPDVDMLFAPPRISRDPKEWIKHPAVTSLLKRAMVLTSRHLGGYTDYSSFALAALARAKTLSPEDMALGMGLGSKQSVYRIRTACRQLVEVGLAAEGQDGKFALHEDNVQKAVALAEARAARKRR